MKRTILLVIWAFCLHSVLFAQNVQQKIWVLNNQRIDFTVAPPQIMTTPLPQYPSGLPLAGGVNGIHKDKDLLFYIDNQNGIRNKYGTPLGTLGLFLSSTEMCVIPVPGSSCKYYLVYHHFVNSLGQCSPNHNFLPITATYSTVDLSLNNGQGGLSVLNQDIAQCYHSEGGAFAVGPLDANGTKRYLYKIGYAPLTSTGFSLGFSVLKFEVTATGISSPVIIYSNNSLLGDMEIAEADLSFDGTKLAFANAKGTGNDVIVLHLNSTTGDLISNTAGNQGDGSSIYDIPSVGSGFSGVEFSPNGNYLFVGQNNVGIHRIDLGPPSGSISILQNSIQYGNSHLELGYNPTGDYKIWATDGTNLGMIDKPNSLFPSFQKNIVQNIQPTQQTFPNDAYQLPDQIDGFDYESQFSNIEPVCCNPLSIFDENEFTASGSGVWTATSNPFNTTGVIKIHNKLLIPTGSDIAIKGMTFEFGKGAKIIIEKGAKLTIDNSILTSIIGCDDLWEGIEVQGFPSENQYATFPGGLRKQGHLVVNNNSLIENASFGVSVSTKSGGIVWASNSTFRNNSIAAYFNPFQNHSPFGALANNISSFKDCTFETTTALLNNGQYPIAFFVSWAADGVGIRGNTFRNTSNQSDVLKRGIGVFSIDAKCFVQGYCSSAVPYGVPCPAGNLIPNTFEGLSYGIQALSSNVINTANITNNIFDNNWRAVLLRGMDFATVTENNFNIGAIANNELPYGLYTDQCSGYKIEANNFTSPNFGSIGTYTWNSGIEPNQIYRNTFNNVTMGSLASQVNGQNISPSTGLEYRCNDYNCDWIDIGLTSGAIALNQGFCDINVSAPAGNTFSPSSIYHLYKNTPATPFYYFFHSNAGAYQPTNNSPSVFVSSSNCNPYNALLDCPSTLSPDPAILAAKKQNLNILAEQEKNRIDGGNTTALISSLNTLSTEQAKGAMMAVSPYASDAALLAYLGLAPPNDYIQQVISANAPVSSSVWDALLQLGLPKGIKDQLAALQTGTSPREALEQVILYYEKERWLLSDELIRYYLNDTIDPNPMDSVIALLKEQGRQSLECQQLAAEIKAGKLNDADATVAAIAAANGGQITDNYCKLLQILLELEKKNQTCFDMSSADETVIRKLATESDKKGCAQAQALLNTVFNETFPETIEEIQLSNSSNRLANNSNKGSLEQMEEKIAAPTKDKNYEMSVFPNPFHDIFTVKTTIPKNIQEAKFVIYDASGKALKQINLQLGETTLEIKGNKLQEGLLFYTVVFDNKIIETGKVLYLKP